MITTTNLSAKTGQPQVAALYDCTVTCVCAVSEGGVVVMGGDSAASDEDGDRTLRAPKVFERRGVLFGVSGEARVGQLIQHVYDVPAPGHDQDMEQFVVRDLSCGLGAFLRESGEELLPAAGDEEMWSLLVGAKGRVFRICSHLSASESATGYDAIGSATPHALGSLASTEGRAPRDRVAVALAAAERHQGGVAGPFTILEA